MYEFLILLAQATAKDLRMSGLVDTRFDPPMLYGTIRGDGYSRHNGHLIFERSISFDPPSYLFDEAAPAAHLQLVPS